MSIESVMPSSHLIFCHPLLLLSPIPTSIRGFSNESTLCMTAIWPSSPTPGHAHAGNQNWKRHMYPIFIAALFTIARTWKQPRCPWADEWIRKLCYVYTMEYYSAIKKIAFESVLRRWMKLEPIIQSEVNQKEKHQYSILMHIYGI